jgi:hypothetical protein
MARKAKVSLGFTRYTIPQKVVFGQTVTDKLTENSSIFTTPNPTVVALIGATNDLDAAAAAAASGDHAKVQIMYEKEANWDEAYRKSAAYVNTIANGNEATILLSGFKSTKTEPGQVQLPGAFENFKVKAGKTPGSIAVECKAMKGVKSFVFLVINTNTPINVQLINGQIQFTNLNGFFAFKVSTKRKVTFEGLVPRNDVTVVGYAVNAAGSGPLCDPAEVLVP